MIQRIQFGKRIGAARRSLHLSQTALAEKFGVSPQAVSKWECGTALPDIELLLELSHLFGITINDLLEDRDPIIAMNAGSKLINGIHCFVPDEDTPDMRSFGDYIRDGDLIRKNWDKARARHDWDEAGRQIAEHGGLILEIGAGPGGGFVPFILKANPDASVVLSDLSPSVIREWKRFLDAESASPNLRYAVCDFTALPFPSESFDVVSDGGGIANAIGSRREAFREAFRILKPGGIFVSYNGFVPQDALGSLPEEARAVLLKEMPGAFDDLYEATAAAGFRQIDSVCVGGWDTDRGDSGFADLCRSLGISLRFSAYIRTCRKE